MGKQPVRALLDTEFAGEWGEGSAGSGLCECRVLRATNLTSNGIDYSTAARRFVPEAKVEMKRLRRGDLVLEAAGGGPGVPVGRVARFDPPDEEWEYLVSNFFRTLRPDPSADCRFVYHMLDNLYQQPRIWQVQQQTTGIINLKVKDYLQLRVPVPPLEEQRRIAEILDTIDETIQATERVIAKLRSAHEALQQQLVPQRARDGVRETRLGALIDPERPIVYGILMPGEHVIGGVPVIKVKDIKDGRIANKRALLHTSQLIDRQYSRSRVRKGDILFTIRGSVGRTAVVLEAHDGANITQDTARIAVTSVNRSYLVAAMATERVTRFIDVHTIGQAVKGVNLRELRRAPILLIGRDEQEIAGAVLDDSIASISVECGRLEKLRLLRTGLSADLLSGRVRTVVA